MSLQLQRIYLKNWRCYQEQTIKFNLDTTKNIWIIFGNNGYGKTSLLEAITWCLYGSEVIAPNTLNDYFNRVNLEKEPEAELLVQLTFKHDGKTYYISRSAKRVKRGISFSIVVSEPTFNIDGQEKTDTREYIELILPKSCKDFFFFDGVEIKRYAQLSQILDTREAIEKILGIPELKNLRDDAQWALHTLEKKLTAASQANQELKAVTTKLTTIQDEIKFTKGKVKEAKGQYQTSLEMLKDVETRANQISDLQGKLNELARLEQQQIKLKNELKQITDKIDVALRQAPIPLMLEFVREAAADLQLKTINTAQKSGSVAELKRLLNEDLCICGRCINDEVKTYIQQQLAAIQDTENVSQDAIIQDNLRNNLLLLSRYKAADLDELLMQRDRATDNLNEITQVITRLQIDTADINQQESREIWEKVGSEKQLVKEKQQKIYHLQTNVENLEKQETQLSRQRETLAGYNQETAILSQQVSLARGLYQAASELIDWHINQCQHKIETITSEIHHRVTNKPEEYLGVQINQDYTLGIKNARGEIINPEVLSAGEKEALAFAFITGLNLASETAAPLIMDTPFGHLDLQHQQNIINSLPQIPSQVIVLATDRDFPEFLLQQIEPYIAETFQINRLDATQDGSIVNS